ncbi:SDR family NAD(P)-dependent oxidoreductase [Streptomyces sp. NPDC057702]|uniref:type I polyketide synthase n=1 Tax=unclassified Streptomyces TaxID=2593676 RepID=UPI00369E7ACB
MSHARPDVHQELAAARRALHEQGQVLRELLLEKYEPIAIVGVGLRFPGGNDTPAGFAEFLARGRSGTGPIPADRWDVAGFSSDGADDRGRVRTRGGGFLDQVDQFDAPFFNVSPKEARFVDPQQRLALHTAWEALEDAGLDAGALRGTDGGVYLGVSTVDYTIEADALDFAELDASIGTGTAHSAVPGRLSYFLGWRGPSLAVDTACSASLVTLHLAAEGLRRGACDIALAGGVNVIHHPRNHVVFSRANMLSADGRCKTFDSAADGYGRSEGCGIVVLKRLSDAKRAGDRILALVRGSAVRQDGESGGLTVPNGFAQEEVMRAALASATLEPGDVQYVEAHGTGTPLGDPIEMGAIQAVFAASHTTERPVLVGSLKTNVGHMEAAAGIGGVIKTALQLHHGRVYPHLHLESPSEHIPWERYAVRVPVADERWQAPTRRALVNSFGFAGTIASAVLEQAPPYPPAEPAAATGGHVFTLSARTERSLARQAERYRRHLADHPDQSVADICYTGNVARAHFGSRLAGVVHDRRELAELLDRATAPTTGPAPTGRDIREVAFLFTGQGAQYAGMAAPLYEAFPVFREHLDQCDALFAEHPGHSVRDLLLGTDTDPERVHQTRLTQPALFAQEWATAQLWRSWGVEPGVLLGHSIGEVVAATVAGLFSLPDAVALVAARSRLMQSVTTPGAMLAVHAAPGTVADLVDAYDDLSFGAFNAPEHCVVSGGADSVAAVAARCVERGVRTRPLAVSHAFHSPLMAEVRDAFRAQIAHLTFREPHIALVSNATGALADPAELATPDYWARHIVEPVDFAAGLATVAARGGHAFIEVGPATTLLNLAQRTAVRADHLWLSSTARDDPHATVIRQALAAYYAAGLPVDWAGHHRGRGGRRVPLPTYAFDTRRYWLPITGDRHAGRRGGAGQDHHPLLGAETTTDGQRTDGTREFVTALGPERPGYLADHVVMGQPVFPGAGYVETLLALQDAVFGENGRPLTDLTIHEPLILSTERPTPVHTRLRHRADGGADVEILSRLDGGDQAIERPHATARIAPPGAPSPTLAEAAAELERRAAADGPTHPARRPDDLYADFAALGLEYGPAFQGIERLTRQGRDVAVGLLRGCAAGPLEHLPPVLLDHVTQSLAGVLDTERTYLPVGIDHFHLLKKPRGRRLRSLVRLTGQRGAEGELTADMLLTEDGRPVFVARGLRLAPVAAPAAPRRRLFHAPHWVKRSLVRASGAERERRVLLVGGATRELAATHAHLRDADALVRQVADAAEAVPLLAEAPTDVCWLWTTHPGPPDDARLRAECEANYRDLLALLAGLERHGFGPGQRLWLVTEGAQWPRGDGPGRWGRAEPVAPAATLWGLGRTLGAEYPAYDTTLVDLPVGGDGRALAEELLAAEADEFQVAYRAGHRHVRRLRPVRPEAESETNVALAIREYGEFAHVHQVPCPDVPPEGDQIQVRVRAAGLNLKDVLNVLGLLRDHARASGAAHRPLDLGFEGAGTVVAAGPDAEFAVGDEVIVSHPGCLRRHVTLPSAMAARKPASLDIAEAAGVATAYVTAFYALHHLAGLRAGESVLVHAAAGGVGQAAVRLAQRVGARVFATASPRKHDLLRAQGLTHVYSSRDLDFADQILAATDGRGVDVVLNSLNKDFVAAGMRALGTGGRFVELGKIGIWTPERAARARPDVAFHTFDLSEFAPHDLRQINREILRTIADLLERGELRPLPTTTYHLDEVEEAFAVLGRGANVGKLVIDFEADTAPPRRISVDGDHTYLITGGLGALGRVTARKLVDLGARHLTLVGRHVPEPAETAAYAAELGQGVRLTAVRCDVADPDDVRRLLARLRAAPRPLGGVLHAAGVLADTPLAALTWEDIDTVFQAKVYGSWQLHRALTELPGRPFLVAFSSVASVVGPAGQGNYAAGNAFLDALAQGRAAQGLPSLSIGWGPWAEVGMAAELGDRLARGITAQGMTFLRPAEGARALATALDLAPAHLLVGEVDWARLVAGRPSAGAFYREVAGDQGAGQRAVDLPALLALPPAARRAAVNEVIRARIATLLHFESGDDIAPDARLLELGLDSLTAVELKNALEAAFQVPLSAAIGFDHPSVALLTDHLTQALTPRAEPAPPPARPRPGDEVGALSDAAAEAELAALVARSRE